MPERSGVDADVKAKALALLARREHSLCELRRKLLGKGFAEPDIEAVLAHLGERNLQSDQRYAEQYVRLRAEKGYGPERIRAELRERGLSAADRDFGFRENDAIDWFDNARKARLKRFGEGAPGDIRARAKQQRYLHYRGFDRDQIAYALGID